MNVQVATRNRASTQIGGAVFLILLFVTLFLPKVPIFLVLGQDVRAEDFLSVLLIIAYYSRNDVRKVFLDKDIMRGAAAFFALCVTSSTFNVLFLESPPFTFIFVLRWLQYFLVGFVGYSLAMKNTRVVIGLFYVFLAVVGSWALVDILTGVSLRYRAWFSGPWEVGSVAVFCLLAVLSRARGMIVLSAILFTGLICVAGEARIQLTSFLAVVYVIFLHRRLGALGAMFVALTVVGVVLSLYWDFILDFYGRLSFSNIKETFFVASEFDKSDFHSAARQNSHLDPSLLERVLIWKRFFILWIASLPYSFFWGIGMGAGGVVIDGLFVRLFLEGGAIGLVIFLVLARRIFARTGEMFWGFVVAAALISVTNDPVTAFRIVFVLFVSVGCAASTSVRAS